MDGQFKYSYFAEFMSNLQLPRVPKKQGCEHQRSLMPLAEGMPWEMDGNTRGDVWVHVEEVW